MSNNTIATNTVYVNESPLVFLVGSAPILNFNYLGSGTLATGTYALYRNKTSVATGNLTISGRTAVTPAISLTLPGDYELYATITDNSVVRVKAVRIMVRKLGVY